MMNEIDLTRVDLNLLVLFEAVFAERHVARAAARLHITPSAVSHGLGRLRYLLNDPLFLRTPKGVVPTERAVTLAAPMAEILERTRRLLSVAQPFDPATSTRRFTIAAPDAVASVLLSPLLEALRQHGPRIDICMRQLLPAYGEPAERAWQTAFSDLESRTADIAVLPSDLIPLRFAQRCLYEEDFVVVARKGHRYLRNPTLDNYCSAEHLVVSQSGDPHGFVDEQLEAQHRSRRVVLTVSGFMFALAVVADTELITVVPKRLANLYAARFSIAAVTPPLTIPRYRLNAVVPVTAMMDAGVAFALDQLARAAATTRTARAR